VFHNPEELIGVKTKVVESIGIVDLFLLFDFPSSQFKQTQETSKLNVLQNGIGAGVGGTEEVEFVEFGKNWLNNYSTTTTTSNPNSTTNAPIPSTNPKMVLKSDPNSSFVSTITVPYSTYVPPSTAPQTLPLTQNAIQNSSSGFPAWGIGLIVLAVVLFCCICMITLLVLTRKKRNQNQANQPILNAPPPPQQSSRQSWGSAMNNDQKRNQNNEQHEQSQDEKSHEEQSREVSEHEESAEKE